ncbi:exosortase/archaeosortase family protein [bacterium]|nr:exosortase/archaeosortase family protein [bacterium]MBU1753392.1 exosortase/archaeosortase family protein [bacterium]
MIKKYQLLKIILLGGVFIGIYFSTFNWIITQFLVNDSNYSHGFLIPFVCLWLVWQMRDDLRNIMVCPARCGLWVIAAGLCIHVCSLAFKVDFISALSMIMTIVGIILHLFGWKMMRALVFPVGFLFFMIPFPDVFTIFLTYKLKIMATHGAIATVNAIGIPCVAEGAKIILPDTFLEVGAPCSGIRSLISLLALGALFAYLLNISIIRRTIVFLSTIPIALLSNVIRIALLCLVAHIYGKEAALPGSFFHDFSGFLVFVIAFGCLYGIGGILSPKVEQASSLLSERISPDVSKSEVGQASSLLSGIVSPNAKKNSKGEK